LARFAIHARSVFLFAGEGSDMVIYV
jgi:hypothetical protein